MKRTAVLLTCFNRRAKTIRCLRQLHAIAAGVDVYLVDDGSTDGTAQEVAAVFPNVNIIRGDGTLFWSRGMQTAWDSASLGAYDYYVWLNDDVVLRDHCFKELHACSEQFKDKAVVAGIIDSHDRSEILYGGTDQNRSLISPNGKAQDVVNMNGNVVLVPGAIFERIGGIDVRYWHDLGDVDYGYRAKRAGFSVVTTRCVVASCDKNSICRVRAQGTNITRRFARLYSPLGSPPSIDFYFRRRHRGVINAVVYYIFVHLINVLPDTIIYRLFGDRYRTSLVEQ